MKLLNKIIMGFKIAFAPEKKQKWPVSLFDVEEAIYPYFLAAFELDSEEDYELARDLLDLAIEEAYQRLEGNVPKIELESSENK